MPPAHAEKDIGALVKQIDERLKMCSDADLKQHNLTMIQSAVALYLCGKENCRATQKEIERYLGVSHPAVVGIISRMEQNGHVTTWMDPADRRNKLVQLTPRSRELGDTMEMLRQNWESTMLRGFTPGEAEELKRLLAKVSDNLA
ncbi:MAG: MarR family winged helix-turn-helix transcriptional regulator [Gemmiger sp.]